MQVLLANVIADKFWHLCCAVSAHGIDTDVILVLQMEGCQNIASQWRSYADVKLK